MQALADMGVYLAQDLSIIPPGLHSLPTVGDPARQYPTIATLPFSNGSSTAANTLLLSQYSGEDSTNFVNATQSLPADLFSIQGQRLSNMGLKFAAKNNVQRHPVRHEVAMMLQTNVSRKSIAYTMVRSLSASGFLASNSSVTSLCNATITQPRVLRTISTGMQNRHTKQECKHMHVPM